MAIENTTPILQLPTGTVKATDYYPAVDTTDFTEANDGTTKKYPISALSAFIESTITSNKLSCRVATTDNLTVTYTVGADATKPGIGATITNAGAMAALTIDGVALAVNDRVLVKNQTAGLQNGLYVVSSIGSGVANWVMTRATDFDDNTIDQIGQGDFVVVVEGTVNLNSIWILQNTGTITIGTTALVFATLDFSSFSGILSLAHGGTSAALTADNGAIVYSNSTQLQLLAHTTTANQVLLSGNASAPSWSSAVYPATTTINQLLYSSAANTITGLATANSSILLTNGSGVPAFGTTIPAGITWNGNVISVTYGGTGASSHTAYALLAGGTTSTSALQSLGAGSAGQLLQSTGASSLPTWTTATFPSGSGTLNHLLRSDGTNWVQTAATTLSATDVLSGLTQLNVDNITLDGNVISTATDDLLLQPASVNAVITGNYNVSYDGIGAGIARFQTATQNNSSYFVSGSFQASATSSGYWGYKSRNIAVGSQTAVVANDNIVFVGGKGSDGTNWQIAGQIKLSAAGTISAGIVPGKWEIATANSAGALTTALSIDQDQAAVFSSSISASGVIQSTASNVIAGSSGTNGSLISYAAGASLGTLKITCANNSGNYENILTNASTSAARTWTLPNDSGTLALAGANADITSLQALTYIAGSSGATHKIIEFNGGSANGGYWSLSNSVAGSSPALEVFSSSTDVGMEFYTKGAGTFVFTIRGTNTTNPFRILPNGLGGHEAIFAFGTPSANRTYTFPDASGTVALTTGSATLNHLLRYNGTNWVETTATTLDATDVLSGLTQLNVDNLRLDGNIISSTDSNGNIYLTPNGTGFIVANKINSAVLGIGSGSAESLIQVLGTTNPNMSVGSFNNSQLPNAQIRLYRSRSTTPGTFSAVQNGDILGTYSCIADDGTAFISCGLIRFIADGAISTSIIPSACQIQTANSSGTLTTALTISSAQISTFTGQVIAPSFSPNTTSGIIGTTTNNDAAAGSVGEFVSSVIAGGSDVSLTTVTPGNVTSISLTAGDWEVWGNVNFQPAATTNVVYASGWVSSTSATLPDRQFFSIQSYAAAGVVTGGNTIGFDVPMQRFSLASTTTIYLSVQASFSVDTLVVCGAIYARRRR